MPDIPAFPRLVSWELNLANAKDKCVYPWGASTSLICELILARTLRYLLTGGNDIQFGEIS